jgi:hypothetical protein
VDIFVEPQERKIGVGRRRGQDLDLPVVGKPSKGSHQIPAVDLLKEPQGFTKVTLPADGLSSEVLIADSGEFPLVLPSGIDAFLEVTREHRGKDRVGKLFQENRGEGHRQLRRDPVSGQSVEDPEERHIALRRRFVKPVESVRPPAVSEHVGKMGVKDQGEVIGRHGLSLAHPSKAFKGGGKR